MKLFRCLLLALALCALHGAARADTCTATMTDVAFGTQSTIGATDAYASGTLTVTCSWTLLTGIPPLLLLPNVAICANFNTTNRVMSNGGNTIAFELYRDISFAPAAVWGGPSVPSAPTPISFTMGGLLAIGSISSSYTVYGKIPAAAIQGAATNGGADTTYTASLAGNINFSFQGALVAIPCTSSGNSAAFSFAARTTVSNNCVINTDPLAFGSQGVLRSDVRTTAAMRVLCTNGNPYRIALNGGSVANNPAARKMRSASSATIDYRISATLDGPVWGDGSNGTAMLDGTGSGALQTLTLYGRVPAQTTPAPGDYKDTVMATIYF